MSDIRTLIHKLDRGHYLSPIEKATIAVSDLQSDGGYLPEEKASQFIMLLIEEANLLPLCRVMPLRNPTAEVSGARIGGRVLRPGTEGTRVVSGDRAKPDTSKVSLVTKLFKGEVVLSDEVLEDNIEREQFADSVMTMTTKAAARDIDDVILNGDTLSADTTLAQLDGVRKQVTSNLVDLAGQPLRPDLLTDGFKSLPTRYQRNRDMMRWLTSPNALEDFREAYAQRATDLGDRHRDGLIPLRHAGVELIDLSLMPQNLGAGTNYTETLLMDPKTIIVGIQRDIRLEVWREAREGNTSILVTLRMDVKVYEEAAAVKLQNVLAA